MSTTGTSSAARPLLDLRFSLVGAGRVGTSLAGWAVAAGADLVRTVGRADLGELASAGQDLLLIAVTDGELAQVAALLAARRQATVALHTSGSQDATVLEPLRAAGSLPGAMHPLKAFPRPLPELEQARGVFFALDGDAAAMQLARRLVAAWGGIAGEVPAAARPLYHFAATLAAGGVATLLAAAAELAARAGLPPAVATGYLELARGTIAAAEPSSHRPDPAAQLPLTDAAAAITGPVARGDVRTFARLFEALRAVAPEKLPLALELAKETLRLLAARQPPTAGQRELVAWLAQGAAWGGVREEASPPPRPPGRDPAI